MRFSDRVGATSPETFVYLERMPVAMRNTFWNAMLTLYGEEIDYWKLVAPYYAFHFFKIPKDDLPHHSYEKRDWVRERFFDLTWPDDYNFLEFVVSNHALATVFTSQGRNHPHLHSLAYVENWFNTLLQRERSGYRFIALKLVSISDDVEVDSVGSAIENSTAQKLVGVREHLLTAISQLAKRPNPDYRNSIKESISAIESAAKELSGSTSKGLSGALTELGKIIPIHGAQMKAFEALYGWTSDAEGIRHSMLDTSTVDEADARYMLVICSAFVNYLTIRTSQAS